MTRCSGTASSSCYYSTDSTWLRLGAFFCGPSIASRTLSVGCVVRVRSLVPVEARLETPRSIPITVQAARSLRATQGLCFGSVHPNSTLRRRVRCDSCSSRLALNRRRLFYKGGRTCSVVLLCALIVTSSFNCVDSREWKEPSCRRRLHTSTYTQQSPPSTGLISFSSIYNNTNDP